MPQNAVTLLYLLPFPFLLSETTGLLNASRIAPSCDDVVQVCNCFSANHRSFRVSLVISDLLPITTEPENASGSFEPKTRDATCGNFDIPRIQDFTCSAACLYWLGKFIGLCKKQLCM